MQQVFRMRGEDGQQYDVPANEMGEFSAQVPNAARVNRHIGKDGQKYDVPEAESEDFKSAVPDAAPMRSMRFADGTTRDFTIPELSKFLRSDEWQNGEQYAKDRAENEQRSEAWAGFKGFLGELYGQAGGDASTIRDTAEQTGNPLYKGYAYAQDLTNSILGGFLGAWSKVTEGAGHALGDTAVGRALVDEGRAGQQTIQQLMPTDTLDTKGGGVVNKVLQTGKNVAAVTGEFAPAALPGVGQAYAASIISAGSVNKAAQIYDEGIENGLAPDEAMGLAAMSGTVDAVGNMLLMGAFKGIWGGAENAAANAVKQGLVRRLAGGAVRTGSIMGGQAAAGNVFEQAAANPTGEYKPEETWKAGMEGFVEGGMFHLVNSGVQAAMHPTQWKSEAKGMPDGMARDALDTPEGRALVEMNSPDATKAIIEARRNGKDVSRKMLRDMGIPDSVAPTVADRNALGDTFVRDYEAYEKEAAKPERKPLTPEEKEAARQQNEEARAAKRQQKADEAADAERAERERLQAEAEQEAAIKERAEEEAKPNAAVEEARAARNEADKSRMEVWPEYAAWIKKNGRKNNAKNWNRFVAEHELDPNLKLETKDQAAKRESAEFERGLAPDEELAAFNEYNEAYRGGRTEMSFDEWLKARENGESTEKPVEAPRIAPQEEGTNTQPKPTGAAEGGNSAENGIVKPIPSVEPPKAPPAPPKKGGDNIKKQSKSEYDRQSKLSTGAVTWHRDNGGRIYNIPVDFARSANGRVVLDSTDSAYERLREILHPYLQEGTLRISKKGRLYFSNGKGVPKELRELLGRELKVGRNPDDPVPFKEMAGVEEGQLADKGSADMAMGDKTRSWEDVEADYMADKANYDKWKAGQKEAQRRAAEDKKWQKDVKSGKKTQAEYDIWKKQNELDEYRKHLEDRGVKPEEDELYREMKRDIEVMQEDGTYDYAKLAAEKDAAEDAEWGRAIGEIEAGDLLGGGPTGEYVKPFSKENLRKAKQGDIIHFDHDEKSFTLDTYDPRTGEMVLFDDADGVRRKYKVFKNGIQEIKRNGRKDKKGANEDHAGDAGGGRGGAAGTPAEKAEGGSGKGTPETKADSASKAAKGTVAELTAKAEALAKEYAALPDKEKVGAKGRELEKRIEEAWKAVEEAEKAEGVSAAIEEEQRRTKGRPTSAPQTTTESATALTPELKERGLAAAKTLKGDAAKPVAELKKMLADVQRQTGANAERRVQALKDLIAYREAAEANPRPPDEVGGAYHGRAQIQETPLSQRLQDPSFKRWAKKHGVAPTKDHLEMYDREQAKGAFSVVKRWLRGVKAKFESRPPTDADIGANDRAIRNVRGDIIGKWDKAKNEVTLYPGANSETVAHEIGWHATYDHAEKMAARGDRRLLEKLQQYAQNAPNAIKADVLAKYGLAADPRMLLDEVGAARFTAEQAMKIKNEAERRAALKWYGKAWEACRDAYKSMLTKMGFNKTSVDALNGMSPENAVEFMAKEMAKGKSIGKAEKGGPVDVDAKETTLEKYVRKAKDAFNILHWVDDVTGGMFSVHREQKLTHGAKQKAFNRAMDEWNDIAKTAKKAGVKMSELDEYMRAKGAADTNRRIRDLNGNENGSGISDTDAARTVLQYERGMGAKGQVIQDLAKRLWALQKEGLMERVRAGLISAEFAADLEAREPFHVPRHNRFDANGEFMGSETNAELAAAEWHKAEGRTTDAGNALGWIMQEYCDAFSRGAENRVRQRLAQAVLSSNGALGRATVVTPANEARLTELTKHNKNGNAQVVIVKQNGKKVALELNGVRGELVARAMTKRGMKELPSWVQKTLRYWASTATEWSPTFAIRNLTADLADVMLLNIGDHGFVRGIGRNASHIANMARLSKDILHYARTGETNNVWLKRYIKAGGLIGGMGREGFTDPNEVAAYFGDKISLYDEPGLKKMARSGKTGVKNVAKTLFGWVETFNKTTEMMNRLADFKTQVERGMGDRDAAAHARDITVDFNEKGENTGITNALYMFSNSTMGAAFRQVKALGRHGAQLTGTMLAIGFIEGLAEAMNGNEEEAEKAGTGTGKDLNEYTRANSLYFRVGGTTVRAPFHAGPLSVIKYTGNCAARYMAGLFNEKNSSKLSGKEAAANIGKEAAGIITHFLGLGDAGPNVLQTITPTIGQWMVQLAQNRDYADRPIQKPKYDEAKPNSANGRRSTADPYKWLAEAMNEWGGGNEGKKGKVLGASTDYAPEVYKTVSEAVGKNVLRDVTTSYTTVKNLVGMFTGDADWDVRNIPVARDFVRKTGGNTQRYYERANQYRENRYELQTMMPNWTAEERKDFVAEHPWAAAPKVNNIISKIGELQKLEDGFVKSGKQGHWIKRKEPLTDKQKEEIKARRLRYQAYFLELAEKHGGAK